jgi:hypothetical protein
MSTMDEPARLHPTPVSEVEVGDAIWHQRELIVVQVVLESDSVVHIVGQRAITLELPVTATVEVMD